MKYIKFIRRVYKYKVTRLKYVVVVVILDFNVWSLVFYVVYNNSHITFLSANDQNELISFSEHTLYDHTHAQMKWTPTCVDLIFILLAIVFVYLQLFALVITISSLIVCSILWLSTVLFTIFDKKKNIIFMISHLWYFFNVFFLLLTVTPLFIW